MTQPQPQDRAPRRWRARPFWPDTRLDLTGATLIDFDLSHCRLDTALFDEAAFAGVARFGGAQFADSAGFRGAQFASVAWFGGAAFAGDTWFVRAVFAGVAWFGGAQFAGDVWFDEAVFAGDAMFGGAVFADDAWFDAAATFAGREPEGPVGCGWTCPITSCTSGCGRRGGWSHPWPSGPHPTRRARGAGWCRRSPRARP